jgi:hypothetical protein
VEGGWTLLTSAVTPLATESVAEPLPLGLLGAVEQPAGRNGCVIARGAAWTLDQMHRLPSQEHRVLTSPDVPGAGSKGFRQLNGVQGRATTR